MPIYEFKCEAGHVFDEFLKLADYDNPMTCQCGKPAKRQITATMLNMDMPNWNRYVSPTTGKLITSYKERKEDMRASGCIDYEPSMKEHAAQVRKRKDAELDKKIDEVVDKEIDAMSGDKRDQLAKEMTTHDVNIIRQTA